MLRLKNNNAYTLPELLITILLMAILFSLGIIISSNMGQSKKLRDYSVAVALAQQAIEVARCAPFELLDPKEAGENSVETDLNTSIGHNDFLYPEFKSGNTTYYRTVTIKDVASKDDPERSIGLKQIKVKVEWVTEGAKAKPFVMHTTVANMN
jgi:prepilin-type N-terminal cleavage/methylation domain-containing protein